MSTLAEIPLNGSNEFFEIEIKGVNYGFRVHFNHTVAVWVLDITRGDQVLVCNIPLLVGCDLVEPFSYLNFNFKMYLQVDGQPYGEADFYNLGSNAHLFVEYD